MRDVKVLLDMEEKNGTIDKTDKKEKRLIRRFAEEEDAVGVVENHSDSCSPDRACHYFQKSS